MTDQTDSILRQFVMLKSANLGERLQVLADGTIVLSDAQAWQTIYDQFMRSPDITKHWSVVWVRSADYWQDEAGQQSIAANFAAVRRGTMIHRLVIIADHLWPKSDHLPHEPIRKWVEDQHNHGLWVGLVRESAVAHESDLLADIGIYGNLAVGMQGLDEQSHTHRVVLSFDAAKVHDAKVHWDRLKPYAVSYFALLDQLETKE